ncbi:VOC family protein [Flaviramulus sp. BrNp1-15]|uniref:VOC family protein n=1 Tax=Flaviramulus sp. BrNp1-15 TaxID=2916754 RepID=UPI001EE8B013|nr:VOC family protein [Flaviramulus sp. BrNp1-15]ULC58979.1 VOC family protein [Flaviramulus sp. BrNp1-15]
MKKLIILLILIQYSEFVIGQSKTDFSVSLNHIALSVKDVNKSAEFYKNTLNLEEITNKTKVDGIRWFSFGEGKELHLISTLKSDVTINKAVHFAITTSNFDAFFEKIKSTNIAYSDWPGTMNKVSIRADGIRQIFIQDPDGYWIEVNSIGQED